MHHSTRDVSHNPPRRREEVVCISQLYRVEILMGELVLRATLAETSHSPRKDTMTNSDSPSDHETPQLNKTLGPVML